MSGANVLMAESNLIPQEDNNVGENETELSTIIYCNDFSISDDEVDSDGSQGNNVATEEVKSSVHCHGKSPRPNSERPDIVTKEVESKTIEAKVKDIAEHHIKTVQLILNSTANFSKQPVGQMKTKNLKDLPVQDNGVKVQGDHSSAADGLKKELPPELGVFLSHTEKNYSSRNKNNVFSKMRDSVNVTTDSNNPNFLPVKNLSKSAKSYDLKDSSSNPMSIFDLCNVTDVTAKKTNKKRQSKGSTYRQMLRKRLRNMYTKYGTSYLVPQTPIYLLKKHAEKNENDIMKVMNRMDSVELDAPFPCTECSLRNKTVYNDMYGNPYNTLTNALDKQGAPTDKKCPDCGVNRVTLRSYGKMLINLRQMIECRDLVVHDVFPDGNCLYAAIVDQLRSQGDFNWNCNSLRACAVAYLRENPFEEDGTHKEMYLDRETWQKYLERNSIDGEWGDHIMLSAIVEVLQQKIVVLGGVSGSARNIIVPKSMYSVYTSKEGCEPTLDQPMSIKVEKKEKELEEDVEKKKNKEIKDKIRNGDKMERETKEEEDKGTKKKKMREEALQKKEKDDDELEDETCLYLGHMSESHYISLRKRGWHDVLQKKMLEKTQKMKQQLKEENPDLFQMGNKIDYNKANAEKGGIDPLSKVPFLHLDFIVKQMLDGFFDVLHISYHPMDTDMHSFELLGSPFENMYPHLSYGRNTLMSRQGTEELMFCFPKSCEKKLDLINILSEDVFCYCITRDTRVHEKCFQHVATASDLIEEPARNMCGSLYLIPKKSKSWRGLLSENKDGKLCLQHMYLPSKPIALSQYQNDRVEISLRQIIAFKCQWPAEAAEWVSRERPANWPPAKDIESIINCGCHVIPVAHGESMQGMDSITWEYTFCVAEKSLLCFSISKQQQACFFIFRLLVEKQLKTSQSVSYQVLKNIFLFACETLGDNIWSKKPGLCILNMLGKLISCLDKGEVPMYFLPSKNLIMYVPRETTFRQAQQLEVLRLNPIISIYWLVDEYNLTSSDFGVTFDDIIVDLERFEEHHSLDKSMTDLLLQASIETARDHMESMEFSSAFQVVTDIYQELKDHNLLKEVSIAEFIKSNFFSSVFLGYLWLFALYVDLNAGTNLVQDVCFGHECKQISFLFGPEIIEYLGDKPVPFIFANYQDRIFPKGVVIVLRSTQKYKAITVGIRYYLDTLEDFAVTENSFMDSHSYYSYLSFVVNLYIELYYAYCKCNEVAEFADVLERFEKMVFKLDNREAYIDLSEICDKLGKYDLMKKAVIKATEKYQSGSYAFCTCEECQFTLSSNELSKDDDLQPPNSAAKKIKPVASSEGKSPYGRYGQGNTSSLDGGYDLEQPPLNLLSSISLLIGSMGMSSTTSARRSRNLPESTPVTSLYKSFGNRGNGTKNDDTHL